MVKPLSKGGNQRPLRYLIALVSSHPHVGWVVPAVGPSSPAPAPRGPHRRGLSSGGVPSAVHLDSDKEIEIEAKVFLDLIITFSIGLFDRLCPHRKK